MRAQKNMKVLDKVDFTKWQEIADICEYATFFHTPTWAKILEESYPYYKIATKLFMFEDGTQVIIPLIESRHFKSFIHKYYSMPFTLYGGIVSDNRIDQKKVNEIFTFLSEEYKFASSFITGNPYYSYELPNRYKAERYFTQVIDITQQFDAIWSNYESSVRNQIRKAKKEGVCVKVANNLNEYSDYFKIYEMALQ